MGWDQGVQVREDLPDYFIRWMEIIYERKFGEVAELQYITWFEPGDILICDFGTEKALEVNWADFMETTAAKRYLKNENT